MEMKIKDMMIEEEASKASVQSLSHDCLAQVFMFLPIIERIKMERGRRLISPTFFINSINTLFILLPVCKKWREACGLAWYDQKVLNLLEKDYPEEWVRGVVSRCGKYLRELHIDKTCSSSIMPTVADNCTQLTRLELSLRSYHEEDFVETFRNMEELTSIIINKTSLEEEEEEEEDRRMIQLADTAILRSLPSTAIQEISINSCNPFLYFHKKFASTLKKLTNLRSLSLSNCQINKKVLKMVLNKKTLTHLSLKSVEMPSRALNFSGLDNLQHLNLDGSDDINDDVVTSIASHCPQLTYLNIDGCSASPKSLRLLGQLKNLKHLVVNWIGEINSRFLALFCDLEIIECCHCCNVTDNGIKPVFLNSPGLQRLDLAGTRIGLKTLSVACKLLEFRPEYPKLHFIVSQLLLMEFKEWNKVPPCLVIQAK